MLEWRWLRRLTLRLRTLFQRDWVERELEEEFQFHIEQRTELEIARGLSPEEARYAALRAMDGAEQRKEECRDMRHVNFIDDLWRDLRYAGRSLRRNPGFATLAVLIMALGIGPNTAIFSIVYATLLAPLPFPDPEQLVIVWSKVRGGRDGTSPAEYVDWKRQATSFQYLEPFWPGYFNLATPEAPERVRARQTSPDGYRMLGE